MELSPRLSMFSEADIEAAARRVVDLSRRQLERIVGVDSENLVPSSQNPYVKLFVSLYRYARGLTPAPGSLGAQLDVCETVLGNPLYAGAEGQAENPLLLLVLTGARLRLRQEAGETLSPEEAHLLD